jgi:hypothetical protein
MRDFKIADPAYMDRVDASRELALTVALDLGPRVAQLRLLHAVPELGQVDPHGERSASASINALDRLLSCALLDQSFFRDAADGYARAARGDGLDGGLDDRWVHVEPPGADDRADADGLGGDGLQLPRLVKNLYDAAQGRVGRCVQL